MASVISNERVGNHIVDKYSFKVLDLTNTPTQCNENSESQEVEVSKDNNPQRRDSDIDSSAMSTSSKEALIESLMKKTDDMSSNFIKLQMKLESMEDEHKKELEAVKESSFNDGVAFAKAQSIKDEESSFSEAIEQFGNSVAKLEESAKEYEIALEGIKSNLITAALDIAKEVVAIELNENAQNIANILSSELIKELQSASKITLKVNPKDHGTISEKVGSLEHVEVISDSAVSEGGVIAMSDAGNIDAQISKRFERVKRAALSE